MGGGHPTYRVLLVEEGKYGEEFGCRYVNCELVMWPLKFLHTQIVYCDFRFRLFRVMGSDGLQLFFSLPVYNS